AAGRADVGRPAGAGPRVAGPGAHSFHAGTAAMYGRVEREEYPRWVRVALFGLHDRAVAVVAAAAPVLVAALSAAYAARTGDARWYAGLLALAAAVACGLGIRWVDRNGRWW